MNKTIGGEFSIHKRLLDGNTKKEILFSSGRCALRAILMEIEQKRSRNRRILLPNYLCDCIPYTVIDAGWTYSFYHINRNFYSEFCLDVNLSEYDAVLLINYFGVTDLRGIIEYIRSINLEIIIIEDDVQAYYELFKSKADYSFTSLRKWFPCPDGAIVNSICAFGPFELHQNRWAGYKFLANRLKSNGDPKDDATILEMIEKGEKILEEDYMCICSEESQTIYANIDIEDIAKKRRKNADVLIAGLQKLGVDYYSTEIGVPLFVPIFIENRDELRKLFFERNIFVPRHWPQISKGINGDSDLYRTELSLICDQRYDADEMNSQLEIIRNFL